MPVAKAEPNTPEEEHPEPPKKVIKIPLKKVPRLVSIANCENSTFAIYKDLLGLSQSCRSDFSFFPKGYLRILSIEVFGMALDPEFSMTTQTYTQYKMSLYMAPPTAAAIGAARPVAGNPKAPQCRALVA